MPNPVSKTLGVSHRRLVATGAYDAFVDIDSQLYIDPHLLSSSKTKELNSARDRFEKYFTDVLKLLRTSKHRGDIFWRNAVARLTFREISFTGLGYSRRDTKGSAIGRGLAEDLSDLATEIIGAGIDDPAIFELVGLLQEGIGADRISDMTAAIILPNLLNFSARVARQLEVKTRNVKLEETNFAIPIDSENNRLIILVPLDVLRHLPVASSWEDIDIVAAHNEELRRRVNPLIGNTWRKATGRRISKADLRNTLIRNPDLLRDLLEQYRAKPTVAYDFESDPALQQQWFYNSFKIANEEPLSLEKYKPVTPKNIIEVVEYICDHFKRLVETNRLSRLLHNEDGSPRRERAAQLTFYAIAQAYCEANDLDISPEADAGVGPVDFKFSRGYREKVTVEVKLSSNPRLINGYMTQLPAYDSAERSIASFYLLIQVTESDVGIRALEKIYRNRRDEGKPWPKLIRVDGRIEPSASRRK